MVSVVRRACVAFLASSVLFAGAAHARQFKTLYDFAGGNDGAYPEAGLVGDGNLLLGSTVDGGPDDEGTIFSFDLATHTETILHDFTGGTDGGAPGALLRHSHTIYGIAMTGGSGCAQGGCGTLFSIESATGGFTLMHSFGAGVDGVYPVALAAQDTTLFGVTSNGGATGYGTVFRIDLATGTESVVYSFAGGDDGAYPDSLLVDGDVLYGTTSAGGFAGCYDGGGCGTIFRLNIKNGHESAVYRFSGAGDGYYPSGLIRTPGAAGRAMPFYGTTSSSVSTSGCTESHVCGTVFQFDQHSDVLTTLHIFTGTNGDGAIPESGVVYDNGILFGTTSLGGKKGSGVVFSIDPVAGSEQIAHDFTASEANPVGPLFLRNGVLFGTTVNGGGGRFGTAFRLTP